MATPVSRSASPEPARPQCDVCLSTLHGPSSCCSHSLCSNCHDNFCPLCLQLLQPLTDLVHTFVPGHGSQFFTCAQVCLEIIFVYSFLLDIRVVSSSINCRMQCTWAGMDFTILVYRNRAAYSGIRTVLPRLTCKQLRLRLVPPTLDAPKLPGSLCSWRFYLEMYAFALDRPETRCLNLLPDSVEAFLEGYTLHPQKNLALWQFEHKFTKYGVFFFASEKHTGQVVCVQCGKEYATVDELHASCLGGNLLSRIEHVYAAQPISIHFYNGVFCKDNLPGDNFGKQLKKLHVPRNVKKITGPLSLICFIALPETISLVPASAAKHLHFLFTKHGTTVPKYFCFDLQINSNEILEGFYCWLCWSIEKTLVHQMNLQVVAELDKFTSCLHLGLYRTITKQGTKAQTPWGAVYSWRDFQAVGYLP